MGESAQGGGSGAAGKAAAPPSDADMPLSELEKALVAAVEDGRTFTPATSHAGWNQGVSGKLIRAMLLGTELGNHPNKPPRRKRQKVRLTGHGIRIKPGATAAEPAPADMPLLDITGAIELGGLAAAGGGFLPPLELEGCRFAEPIELSGARLQSLTLRNCRFALLRAEGAKFDGGVLLGDCGPRHQPDGEEACRCMLEDMVRLKKQTGTRKDQYSFFPVRKVPPGTDSGCTCAACTKQEKFDNCAVSCVVDLSSAFIDGTLEIRACYLRAPPPRETEKQDPNIRGCSAAKLDQVQVRDRIEIVRCTFVGGASFVSAEVGDDIWIRGGKFLAPANSYVLDFQFAIVGGIVALQAAAADVENQEEKAADIAVFPVIVIGQLTGINLNAGEIWIGEGFYYGRDNSGQGSFPSVNFAKADVARSFKVGAYHPQHVHDARRPTGEARIHGEICLAAANLGKNLELHGVGYEGIKDEFEKLKALEPFVGTWEDLHLKLRAHGLKVDRRVYLSHTKLKDAERRTLPETIGDGADGSGSVTPPRPDRTNATDAEGACGKEIPPAALDLWKSTIGTGFRLGEGCSCDGAVRLNSCVIGRELNIACRMIESSQADRSADEFLPGDVPVALDISESTIMGHVKIGRRVPRAEGNQCGDIAITVKGAVTLESSSVQGSLLLAHLEIDLYSDPEWTATARSQENGSLSPHRHPRRVALNLRDCTCGSDFEVHALRWKLPTVTKEEAPPARPWAFWWQCYKTVEKHWWAVIDLRGFQCDLLIDGFGAQWSLEYRLQLRLAGIRIGDVEPPFLQSDHAPVGERSNLRLRWLAFQQARQKAIAPLPAATEGTRQQVRQLLQSKAHNWPGLWTRTWTRFYCSEEEHFFSQPYDTFATAYRKAGEDSAAEAILVEKKNVYNVVRFHRLRRKWYFLSLPVVAGVLLIVGGLVLEPLILRSGLVPASGPDVRFAIAGIVAAGIVLLAWPAVVTLFQAFFRSGFRYGLSPGAALISFSILIALGWIGVHKARNGSIATVTDWGAQTRNGVLNPDVALVLDFEYEPIVPDAKPPPPTPEPAAEPEPGPCSASQGCANASPGVSRSIAGGLQVAAGTDALASKWPPDAVIEGQAIHAQAVPCNRNVSSLLYALDVFIPLIDLDQERRCSVRDADPATGHDAYFGWRVLKALYELLGWVVTSLVILTITGVLRRDLER